MIQSIDLPGHTCPTRPPGSNPGIVPPYLACPHLHVLVDEPRIQQGIARGAVGVDHGAAHGFTELRERLVVKVLERPREVARAEQLGQLVATVQQDVPLHPVARVAVDRAELDNNGGGL